MDSMQRPLYEPLDESKAEIRLLEVLPREADGFKLITVPLAHAPEYAALSYVWGNPDNQDTIILEGRNVSVGKNLASFLSRIRRGRPNHSSDRQNNLLLNRARLNRQLAKSLISAIISFVLRRPSHSQDQFDQINGQISHLWVDAVCINQEDVKERSQQVQLMDRIYSSAQAVYSWVGTKDYSLAFEAIRTIARQSKAPNSYSNSDSFVWHPKMLWRYPSLWRETGDGPYRNKAWSNLYDLVEDQYWDRLWIFQETVLAQRMFLISPGTSILNWDDLQIAASSLASLSERLAQGQEEKPRFLSSWVWLALAIHPALGRFINIEAAKSLVKLRTTMAEQGTIASSLPPDDPAREALESNLQIYQQFVWNLSLQSHRFRASDPKDYVYGLLAITQLPITPDYSTQKKVSEIYMEYADVWLQAHCHRRGDTGAHQTPLAFLSLAGAFHSPLCNDIPSWAPNFLERAIESTPLFEPLRNTFEGDFPDSIEHPHIVAQTQTLAVWGFQLEPISRVIFVMEDDDIVSRMTRFGSFASGFVSRHPQYISGIPSLQAVARLLATENGRAVTRMMVLYAAILSKFMASAYMENVPQSSPDSPSLGSDATALFRNWGPELYKATFPDTDLEQLGLTDNALFDAPSAGMVPPPTDIHWLSLLLRLGGSRFFETNSGFIGWTEREISEGDSLCVFQGCNDPTVVRQEEGSSYKFVGTAFVVDLNLERFIEAKATKPQWFNLR